MFNSPVSTRFVFKVMFLSFLIILLYSIFTFFDSRTKVVFCDVSQGDSAYIRVKNKVDILIDAGPDRKILNCLGKEMPFYDRTIELAFLSHPQKDHYGGYLDLIDRYKIKKFLTVNVNNQAISFQKLKEKLAEKQIPIYFPSSQTTIRILTDKIVFLWPDKSFLRQNIHLPDKSQLTQKNRETSKILGSSTIDLNHFSLVFNFIENDYKILFTGDISPMVLNILSRQYKNETERLLKTTILKVPHHGSKNGLTYQFFKLADPYMSVISVGKNNSYGHPSKSVLDMLKASGTKIRRTDKEGDIVFKLPN